jgi:hypothetical protein
VLYRVSRATATAIGPRAPLRYPEDELVRAQAGMDLRRGKGLRLPCSLSDHIDRRAVLAHRPPHNAELAAMGESERHALW